MALTKKQVDGFTDDGKSRDIRWDGPGGVPNFGERVYPSGKESFVHHASTSPYAPSTRFMRHVAALLTTLRRASLTPAKSQVRARLQCSVLVAALAAVLLLAVPVEAQTTRPRDGARYQVAEVFFPDNRRFEVADLLIEGDRFSFRRGDARTRTTIALREVAAIRVRTGDQGWRYALSGFFSGAGFGLGTAWSINNRMLASVEAHGSPPGSDEWLALSLFLPIAGRSRRGLHQYQAGLPAPAA